MDEKGKRKGKGKGGKGKKAKGKKGKGKRFWGWERRWLRRVRLGAVSEVVRRKTTTTANTINENDINTT